MKMVITFFLGILAFLLLGQSVQAYEYPIQELGNCRDRKECQLYCDVPQNHAACWSYKVYGQRVLAEETPETKVAELGITFPVAELGNCTSIASCKAYCSQPANRDSCRAYAESHGLTRKEHLVEKAATELGCTTAEKCKAYCSEEVNREACRAFAKRYHLKAAIQDKLIEIAKNELGCTTKEQCRQLCAEEVNRSRCEAFARKMGVVDTRREELIQRAKGQLGCTSFEDCRAFCQNPDNHEKCRNFGSAVRQRVKDQVQEKLGCTTAEECRKECEANPEKCPNFPGKLEKMRERESQVQDRLKQNLEYDKIKRQPPAEILKRPGTDLSPVKPELVSPPLYPLKQTTDTPPTQ